MWSGKLKTQLPRKLGSRHVRRLCFAPAVHLTPQGTRATASVSTYHENFAGAIPVHGRMHSPMGSSANKKRTLCNKRWHRGVRLVKANERSSSHICQTDGPDGFWAILSRTWCRMGWWRCRMWRGLGAPLGDDHIVVFGGSQLDGSDARMVWGVRVQPQNEHDPPQLSVPWGWM